MVAKVQHVGTRSKGDVTEQPGQETPRKLPYHDCYKVKDLRQSECAHVVFVSHTATKQISVLKALKEYKDETRYALGEREDRYRCLLEALCVNRVFSSPFSGIYKGLVRLVHPTCLDEHLDIQRDLIITDALVKNPTIEQLDGKSEYALLMTELPEDKRLDDLLIGARANTSLLEYYGRLLVDRMVFVHQDKRFYLRLDPCEQQDLAWGSLPQLKKKLWGNLQFLREALVKSRNLGRDYDWCKEQSSILPQLLDAAYAPFFADRVDNGRIKRCHGDLKAPNIWIAPHYSQESNEVWDAVFLLDAIDFNPCFANIDILSDFAMLAVDVEVRMRSDRLTNFMIERYLSRTGQLDERAKVVLNYYMLEKALVGAAVSVIDHDLMNLSRAFLNVARKYAESFVAQLSAQNVASALH